MDPDDEFTKFHAHLQEHVPYWTVEPEFENWCDPANPEGSLAEDTQRQIELGNSFADKFRSEYSGAKLRWVEMVFASHANWWKKEKIQIRPLAAQIEHMGYANRKLGFVTDARFARAKQSWGYHRDSTPEFPQHPGP